uniref:F-box domain-containing protein n=1 Tax=Oryza barthii TaxID=65489 RepID=A0A0D3GX96_9ORYZ
MPICRRGGAAAASRHLLDGMSRRTTTARWVPRDRPEPAGRSGTGAPGCASHALGQMPRRRTTTTTARWVRRQGQKGEPGGSGHAAAPVDRLSALPDTLLHHVMSFLKAWEVVRTCVLSRRWRDLWASAPCVDIRLRGSGRDGAPPEDFGRFVYRLLLAREVSAPVDTLRLRSSNGEEYAETYDNDDVNIWICSAIKRNVRVIHLNGHRKDELVLEHTAFVSHHLKILKLSHIKLDGKILKQLSSQCTSLEDLELNNCPVNGGEILSVSLKKLTMVKCSITVDLTICAPNLELLCCITPYYHVPLFENLSSLVAATIMLDDSFLRRDEFLYEVEEETSDDEDDNKTTSDHCDSKMDADSDAYDDDDNDDILYDEYLNSRHGNLVDDYNYGSDIDSDDDLHEYSQIANECRGGRYGYCHDSKWRGSYYETCKLADSFSGKYLLRSLSSARSLELLAHSGEVVMVRELRRCSTFGNLKTLSLGEWCMAAEFDGLIFLLQESPNLEMLFLKLELSYSNKEAINIGFELKERSFACKNLEVVNIRCSKDDERVHMLAELFVANGLPVEKIYVRRTGSTYSKDLMQTKFDFKHTAYSSKAGNAHPPERSKRPPPPVGLRSQLKASDHSAPAPAISSGRSSPPLRSSQRATGHPLDGMSRRNTTGWPVPRGGAEPTGRPGPSAPVRAAHAFGQMPRRRTTTTARWVRRHQVHKGKPRGAAPVDRLSALPDALLHHVMSFLKAWEVVRTCVLSRRWRHTWASAPCVDIRAPSSRRERGPGRDSDPPEDFGRFVYRLLLAREVSAPVDTLRLRSSNGEEYAEMYDNDDVNMWISSAIKRNARVIHLNGHREDDDLLLEHTAFVSQRLKILKLSNVNLDWKIPRQLSSRCTSLTELELNNCPVNGGEISSVSLKKLRMVKCLITVDLSICAPNLELLCCITPYHRVPLFKNLSSLVAATIVLDDSFLCRDDFLHEDERGSSDDEDDNKTISDHYDKMVTNSDACGDGNLVDEYNYGSDIDSDDDVYEYSQIANECRDGKYSHCHDSECCSSYHDTCKLANSFSGQDLLCSLSNARSLELLAHSGEVVMVRELRRCSKFGNLKTLSLGEWCMAAEFDGLIFLLQETPNLERLFLKLELNYDNKEAVNIGVKLKERSFACKNLEVVNIRCSKDDGRVHMLAELFGANGLPLEKIFVRRTGSTFA